MIITLYNNKSNNDVVHKALTEIVTLTGVLKDDTEVETPYIVINKPANFINCNYAYIPDFGRYYYISKRKTLSGQRVALTLKSDALTSFFESYKTSQVIAKRSTSHYNLFIQDDAVTHLPQPIYIYRKLNFAFSPSASGNKYLLRIGG